MSKAEIKKVVIEVEGKEIVLSFEGAKKLKEILSEMFGREVIKEVRIFENYKPYWNITYPQVWCSSSNSGTVSYRASTQDILCKVS